MGAASADLCRNLWAWTAVAADRAPACTTGAADAGGSDRLSGRWCAARSLEQRAIPARAYQPGADQADGSACYERPLPVHAQSNVPGSVVHLHWARLLVWHRLGTYPRAAR